MQSYKHKNDTRIFFFFFFIEYVEYYRTSKVHLVLVLKYRAEQIVSSRTAHTRNWLSCIHRILLRIWWIGLSCILLVHWKSMGRLIVGRRRRWHLNRIRLLGVMLMFHGFRHSASITFEYTKRLYGVFFRT